MSRRIEIEITSARDDATFTWRAAGARQPKGVVAASTLPAGASIGDRFRVELDSGLDGSEISQVIRDRAPRAETNRIELVAPAVSDDALVTSRLAGRSKGGAKPKRRDRPQRREGDKKERTNTPRRERSERPKRTTPPRPRTPRLRAGNEHRRAFLAALAEEQRPIAEKLQHGGLPGLRKAIEDDNAKRRAQGQPEMPADGLVAMAEKILPRLQDAEWQDRADAALATVDEVDLRDLRSVVVAADDHARDATSRELAAELRTRLAARVERAQAEWLGELESALDDKRLARVLNLSSRPPKAGAPLPSALTDRMIQATNEALAPTSATGRWIALLDALAYSPIRNRVTPQGVPSEVSDELLAQVRKHAGRLPSIAAAFDLSAARAPKPVQGSGAKDGTH